MRKAAVILTLLALGVRAEAQETKPAEPQTPPAAAPAVAPAEAAPTTPAPAPEKKPLTFVLSDKSTITISGRAWGTIESVRSYGQTPVLRARYRVTNDSSFLRFRGEYAVSDSLKAWAQIESQFAIDGAASTVFDSPRNTGAGFTGGFGTAFIGRWDSPYKEAINRLDPYVGTSIAGYYNILGQLPTSSNLGNTWDSRLTNGAQYWTPKMSGFQVRAAASVGETILPNSSSIQPHDFSFAAIYDGPVYLSAAYEVRYSCANANTAASPTCSGSTLSPSAGTPPAVVPTKGKDQGFRLGVGYDSKPTFTKVSAAWERLDFHTDATATTTPRNARRSAVFFSLVQGLGGNTHQLVGTYGLAGPIGGSNNGFGDGTGTRANYFTVGYWYNVTKDLRLYANYVKINNSKNVAYTFGTSGFSKDGGVVTNGGDPDGVGAGIWFMF